MRLLGHVVKHRLRDPASVYAMKKTCVINFFAKKSIGEVISLGHNSFPYVIKTGEVMYTEILAYSLFLFCQ